MSTLTIRERSALSQLRLVRLDAPLGKRRPIPTRLPIVIFGSMVAAVAVCVIGIAKVLMS